MSKYKVVDLFAGAGGLSLGFVQTGKFEIKAAFENNPAMQETYKYNHPNTAVFGDIRSADYKKLIRDFGEIDVVIGGPPCQGFSNANRQKSQTISQNNMLVKEYIRAIQELKPKAFVMENVSMLKSDVHRFYLNTSDKSIVKKYKIATKETPILLLEKECYFDRALKIIKNTKLIEKYLWDDSEYLELNIIFKNSKNREKLIKALDKHEANLKKISERFVNNRSSDYIVSKNRDAFEAIIEYYDGNIEAKTVVDQIKDSIYIQRMLKRAKELYDNDLIIEKYGVDNGLYVVVKSYAVYDYLNAILGSNQNGYVIKSKVLCAADYGAPQKRMRFVVIGVKRKITEKVALPNGTFDEDQYRTVKDAIKDLESLKPRYDLAEDVKGIKLKERKDLSELAKSLRNSDVLKNHLITRTSDVAMERFRAIKEGENFHSLSKELKENTYTDVKRTQNTIYLRLRYNEPCGTVVNVRKSMWIHPTRDRAISVREAARLQTFPDSFVFCGTKDKQYQQVGNAVPPILAKAIAEKLDSILSK